MNRILRALPSAFAAGLGCGFTYTVCLHFGVSAAVGLALSALAAAAVGAAAGALLRRSGKTGGKVLMSFALVDLLMVLWAAFVFRFGAELPENRTLAAVLPLGGMLLWLVLSGLPEKKQAKQTDSQTVCTEKPLPAAEETDLQEEPELPTEQEAAAETTEPEEAAEPELPEPPLAEPEVQATVPKAPALPPEPKDERRIRGLYSRKLAVKTSTGVFVGRKHEATHVYLGIPYAKPPVGELRWKAPQKPEPSRTVYNAARPGFAAPQKEGTIAPQSENCLTLNIWKSAKKPKNRCPVLVYLHGGDFVRGAAVDSALDGTAFVRNNPDILFVTLQYRLGIFGFIDFSQLSGGEDFPDAPNLGLLDQICALEWIRENIAAFGGDPDNITLMGDGAGAVSILMLSVCEKAKGLFRKAIPVSGSVQLFERSSTRARHLGNQLARRCGADSVAELQAMPAAVLMRAAEGLRLSLPVCDGSLIPADLMDAFLNGRAKDVAMIMGVPAQADVFGTQEQLYERFADALLSRTDEEWLAQLRQYLDRQKENGVSMRQAKKNLADAFFCGGPAMQFCGSMATSGGFVRMFYWCPAERSDAVSMVRLFLCNSNGGDSLSPKVRDAFRQMLVNFLTRDDPTLKDGAMTIEWPGFSRQSQSTLRVSSSGISWMDGLPGLTLNEADRLLNI